MIKIDGFDGEKRIRFESQPCPLPSLGKKEKRFKFTVQVHRDNTKRYDGPMEWFTGLKVY